MAKVKLKTNARPKTARNLDGAAPATGKKSTRRTTRTTKKNIKVEAEAEKKGGGGVLAIILMLVLIGGGGAGGYYYIKMNQKVQTDYIVTPEEATLMEGIDKRTQNVQVEQTELEYILRDVKTFQSTYTIAQIVGEEDEEKKEFYSPNIPLVQEIKDDAVEGLASASREQLRKVDYNRLLKEKEDYILAKQQEALRKTQEEDEEKRRKAAEQAKVEAHEKKVAKGKAIDENKPEVRWNLLDVDMFDRSLFKPLEGKFAYDFLTAEKRIDQWYKFELDAQKNWGKAMVKIIKSARYTFGILSNSGTDHRGWVFFYEKRKGTLNSISKMNFKIRVVDNVEGVEIVRVLERPIIDIQPDEFWKLLSNAVDEEGLKKSTIASKNWKALKEIHPGKSDAQILKFGYASLMYMLKQFPAAKKMIKEISEISTDVLLEEIKFVEPTFNRREMKIALDIASGLYGDGKRQDALIILDKMKNRFDFTDEWSEFEDDFNRLKNDAMKVKKR